MMKTKQDKESNRSFKIFIVDDHPIVREGLAGLINKEADMRVCGEADDAAPAMKQIAQVHPDAVIVDISLKSSDGIELTKDIQYSYPQLPVLVLSMYEESYYAERALKAGAMGYVMKREARKELIAAIRKILDGQFYFSAKCSSAMLGKLRRPGSASGNSAVDTLSDRELQVFRRMGQGDGTKEIAEKLCLSISTIETYYAHIKRKLDMKNNRQLRHFAIDFLRHFAE